MIKPNALHDSSAAAVPASRYAAFFSIVVVGCLTDLATKSWIFGRLGMPGTRPQWVIWRGVFSLTTSLNEGALFGLGQGWTLGFAALSIVAAVAIVIWLFGARAANNWALTIALALIMAGIFGNLYDRLGLPGLTWNFEMKPDSIGQPVYAVRDWLLFTVPIVHREWPVFNIADSMLVAGAGLLFLHLWLTKGALEADAKPAAESRPEPVAIEPTGAG
ncbi:MAG TPA: signal peptidase II [Pirellulales bacterium]|nr:signal peptidase II [Pirellulales bacterium]